jgi:sugar lactone lactonase YvrE/Tfp pilus assembly protein PilE
MMYEVLRIIANQLRRTADPKRARSSIVQGEPLRSLRSGFTMVKLLVVIVVIAILAAITVVVYNGITGRPTESSTKSDQPDQRNTETAVERDQTTSESYPTDAGVASDDQGLNSSGDHQLTYKKSGSGNNSCVSASNAKVSTPLCLKSPSQQIPDVVPGSDGVPGTDGAPGTGVVPVVVVSTLAGSTRGFADGMGTGTAAQFFQPVGVAVDASGTVYVADYYNHRIRKISPEGVVSTLAGSGTAGSSDGTGAAAQFDHPASVAVDSSGTVYVADAYNNRIRKISPAGFVSTLAGSGTAGFADGTGAEAQFNYPASVAVDSSGTVYVADINNHRIRKISPAGVVSTLAGSGTAGFADGTGAEAQFNYPYGVAVDSSGTLYVADINNHRIRKISPAGVVSTLAGSGTAGFADGTGAAARFYQPTSVAVDTSGTVYVADTNNNRIRKISPAGVVSTLAGSTFGFADGTGAAAQFNYPYGVAVDSSGSVYVADFYNNRIRKISPAGVVSTLAGSGTAGSSDGTGTVAQFGNPAGAAVDSSGTVYVADYNNHSIRKITPAGVVSTLAGSGTAGFADGTGAAAQFFQPTGVAVDASGTVYVADYYNCRIRKISPAGVVSTLAGSTPGFADGTAAEAQFLGPGGVAVDASGTVYVADTYNNRIRIISPAGVVSTLAGSGTAGFADGTGAAAQFDHPASVAVDTSGTVYVADTYNHRIRKITPAGVVSTLAGSSAYGFADGTGAAAQFLGLFGVAVDTSGTVYAGDAFNNRIRKISPEGVVSTLAGSGTAGSSDGTGAAAQFDHPTGVAVDRFGTVYVADAYNNRIRKITQ